MATFQVKYHCVLGGNQWAVSFYRAGTSARQMANDLVGGQKGLLEALLGMMHPAAAVIAVSARAVADETTDTPRRDTYKLKLAGRNGRLPALVGGGIGRIPVPLADVLDIGGTLVPDPAGRGGPDVTNTAVKIQFWTTGTPVHTRLVDISGVADELTEREAPGATVWSPDLLIATGIFINAVVNTQFLMRYPEPVQATGPFSWQPVMSYRAEVGSADVNTNLRMRQPHGWQAGQWIQIRAAAGCAQAGLIGGHRVLAVSPFITIGQVLPDQAVVNVRYRGETITTYPVGMLARRQRWRYAPIAGGDKHSVNTRQRGARTDGGKGRARSKSCRK